MTKTWIQTYTGKAFYPLDPRVEDVDINDIAHSLAMQCRYNGHTRVFYSVAEHSVNISRLVPDQDALWGLLHDASEAYLCDLPRPLKHAPGFWTYKVVEDNLMRVIAERFNLQRVMPEIVSCVDGMILNNERAILMREPPQPWDYTGAPLDAPDWAIVHNWDPTQAEKEFLLRYRQLLGGDHVS